MPKKTKAQKMKIQNRVINAITSVVSAPATVPGIGHFWTRKDGLRLLLVSQSSPESESAAVNLLCIDERRDGLIKCQSATFDHAGMVADMMGTSPFEWVRGTPDQHRKYLGIGLRILNAIAHETPEGCGAAPEEFLSGGPVQLPPGIYPCPVCDAPLEPGAVETVKESAQKGFEAYIACDRCRQKRNLGAKRSNYAIPMHLRLKNALLESEEFTLTPKGWDMLERAVPTESASEAIGLMLVQDVLKGIAYAVEKSLADTTVPNPQLNDGQIMAALEILKTALVENQELKAVDPYEVNFILEGLDEAIALVKQIFREEVETDPDPQAIIAAVEMVLVSVRRHAGRTPDKRSYIQFISDYV